MSIDLDAIKARLAAATPGPWDYVGQGWITHPGTTFAAVGTPDQGMIPCTDADADLIAHAPTDLAALLAEVRALRKRAANLSLERAEFADEAQSLRDRLARIPERTTNAEAEVERLRAVVDSAKAVVDAEYAAHSDPYEVGIKIAVLRAALDALDAGGES
ncbi:MAG: hypothetical protein BGO26_10160 [Actinobacteria bacterium 69-20]|nr:hypothetical protein [Actinomycetota bacterium]OJV23262.1 MAG: hypothetical protein BGO26_10160 [Actinobacteria bacterium 69-20]